MKFLETFFGPNYSHQMEKFLKLGKVEIPFNVTNCPYEGWTYKNHIKGINLVNIRKQNETSIFRPNLYQYASKQMNIKNFEDLNRFSDKQPTDEELAEFQNQLATGLPSGLFLEQTVDEEMSYVPGVKIFFQPGIDLLRSHCLNSQYSLPILQMATHHTSFGGYIEPPQFATFNISLFGGGRIWTVIDMFHLKKLEILLSNLEKSEGDKNAPSKVECFQHSAVYRGYTFTDQWLKDNNIKFTSLIQMPGDIVITFPAAFYFGFNLGFNFSIRSNLLFDEGLPYYQTFVQGYSCVVSILFEYFEISSTF